MDKVKRHVTITKIASALFGMLILTIVMQLAKLSRMHLYQSMTPSSAYYVYESVEPIKSGFQKWELLEFETRSFKKRDIDMRWEDTLFCDDWVFTRKYGTQLRPENWKQISLRGATVGVWAYYLPVPENESLCRVCGAVIWYTSLWYKKTHTYCTEYFEVNL